MGLDMYACSVDKEDHPMTIEDELPESEFSWRKHTKLHQFMHDYYYNQVEDGSIIEDQEHVDSHPLGAFNCIPLYLPKDKIEELLDLVKRNALPGSDGGFFWGQQFQDETAVEERDKDILFCKWALDETERGNYIYYSCWF